MTEDLPLPLTPERRVSGRSSRSSSSKHLKLEMWRLRSIEHLLHHRVGNLEARAHLFGRVRAICNGLDEALVVHALVECLLQSIRTLGYTPLCARREVAHHHVEERGVDDTARLVRSAMLAEGVLAEHRQVVLKASSELLT